MPRISFRMNVALKRMLACLFAMTFLGQFAAFGGPGPGINQVTFLPSEVGTEIFNFPTNVAAGQPTSIDFQHGYLYIGAAHSLDNTIPGKASWINFTNPRSPTVIAQVTAGGNKPHMIAFYRDRMIDGF